MVIEHIEHCLQSNGHRHCFGIASIKSRKEESARIARINYFAVSVMGKDIWHRRKINAELSRDVLP